MIATQFSSAGIRITDLKKQFHALIMHSLSEALLERARHVQLNISGEGQKVVALFVDRQVGVKHG